MTYTTTPCRTIQVPTHHGLLVEQDEAGSTPLDGRALADALTAAGLTGYTVIDSNFTDDGNDLWIVKQDADVRSRGNNGDPGFTRFSATTLVRHLDELGFDVSVENTPGRGFHNSASWSLS